mmetsp:Transcript_27855/g.46607  ORF Transcript_27855/g.46607 Transcript_27855/m.46607 type:complete len:276 (+) Transcript_27855:1278-2105(+)
MYMRKLESYSTSLSPSFISTVRPRRMSVRDTTGSSTASMSSPMFSMSSGSPFSIHCSTVSMYLACDSWMILSPLVSSRFMIQLMPCSCGSIMRLHRAALVMMAPFSMDSGSVGRPSLFHAARPASVDSRSRTFIPSVMGMARSITSFSHFSKKREKRNLELKGPRYDTNDDAKSTSPTSFSSITANSVMAVPQRLFSEDSPLTNLSARSAFCCVLSACAMAPFLSCVAFIRFSSNAATLACSSPTFARIPVSFLLAPSSFLFASARLARLGATTW